MIQIHAVEGLNVALPSLVVTAAHLCQGAHFWQPNVYICIIDRRRHSYTHQTQKDPWLICWPPHSSEEWYLHPHLCLHLHLGLYIYISIYIYLYMYVYLCICIYSPIS